MRCLIALLVRTFLFQPFNIPVRLDGGHAAGRRLPLCREIRPMAISRFSFPWGRLLPSFGRVLARGAPPRRRGGVQTALRSFHRLHQAADRASRRPRPDDRRRALSERQAGAQGAGERLRRDQRRRLRTPHRAISRDPAGREILSRARQHPGRADGQHPGVHRAAGPLFHDGRQSRQFGRQPGRVGYVPAENLVGKAEFRFFSIDGDKTNWWSFWTWPCAIRYARMFTLID